MANKVYKHDTATRITFDFDADITGYQSVATNVRHPAGTVTVWTLTVSNASSGAAYFESFFSTTLNTVGNYYLQPIVWFTSTSSKAETAILKIWGDYE